MVHQTPVYSTFVHEYTSTEGPMVDIVNKVNNT